MSIVVETTHRINLCGACGQGVVIQKYTLTQEADTPEEAKPKNVLWIGECQCGDIYRLKPSKAY